MLRQQDLYHLYAGIREQLHSILRAEDTGDPVRQAIRREMAEELLDHIYASEEGLKTQHHYKEQWTGGVDEA
jgi:hypothetical protein